jgi:hypothetical protein
MQAKEMGKVSKKRKVVSRTELAMKKRVSPVVVKRTIDVYELRSPYSGNTRQSRKFTEGSTLGHEEGGEKQAYLTAAHCMLSTKHFLWYEDYDNEEKWENLKQRLARWLKWHDQIRQKYIASSR